MIAHADDLLNGIRSRKNHSMSQPDRQGGKEIFSVLTHHPLGGGIIAAWTPNQQNAHSCSAIYELLFRKLNRSRLRLERARCSFRLTNSGRLIRTPVPQPQSSPLALGARSLLVSVDELRSLSPAANAPLGHRFLRSPQPATECSVGKE